MQELIDLVAAIDAKWRKTTPPKELIEPLERAREYLNELS